MSGERTMRDWYAPLEIYTFSWLRVAVVVNICLLLFDYLKSDGFAYSLAGIALVIALVYSLPDGSICGGDVSLALSGAVMRSESYLFGRTGGFVIWMEFIDCSRSDFSYWISSPRLKVEQRTDGIVKN